MSARDDILTAVQANRPALEQPLPKVPCFDDALPPRSLLETFRQSLTEMGGDFVEAAAPGSAPGTALGLGVDPLAPVRDRLAAARVVCSSVPEAAGHRPLAEVKHPRDLADVDIGIVRAAFAVAETGSVCLTEATLGVNALGYLPQHLIVLLDPEDIVLNLHHAYARPELKECNYAVFHSGPSATADIEGVLIHGAQGVRSLTVVSAPRRAAH